MDRKIKDELISRLVGQMLKTIEYIFRDDNPRLTIIYRYDDPEASLYIYGDDSEKVSYIEDGELEYYSGEIARDRYLSAVLYSYSHIFRHMSEILLEGSEHHKERMFRTIRKVLSKIEEEERKYYERSLVDGRMIQSLELKLCQMASEIGKKEV